MANESVLDVFGTIDSLPDLDVIPTYVTAYDDVYTEAHLSSGWDGRRRLPELRGALGLRLESP